MVEYRLIEENAWPAQKDDVIAALDSLERHAAELGIDPERVYIAGFSAGANLAMLAASERQDRVAGLALFFPIIRAVPPLDRMYGGGEEMFEQWGPLSTIDRLSPSIIFSGDMDILAPVAHSIELYNALRSAGRKSDLRIYSGLVHEFSVLPGMVQICAMDADAYFRRIADAGFAEEVDRLQRRWEILVSDYNPT